MKYELIVCRKRIEANQDHFGMFVDDFKAKKINDQVWGFETRHPFEGICHAANQYLDEDYRYVIIGFDGTEDNPIPKTLDHNDGFIGYCISALGGSGAGGRYGVRAGAELHFANQEYLLRCSKVGESD